jgi:xylulokinase
MWWLGIDVGTANTKVCVVGPEAVVAGTVTRPTATEASVLQADVRALVAEAVELAPEPIQGVGISGMAETGAALDRDGRALTGLIGWREQPGIEQAAEVAAELGAAGLFARTGLRLSAKLPVVTWRWLRDTAPEVLAATRLWAGAADLALHALTGTFATHLTHAQRTGGLDLTTRCSVSPPSQPTASRRSRRR